MEICKHRWCHQSYNYRASLSDAMYNLGGGLGDIPRLFLLQKCYRSFELRIQFMLIHLTKLLDRLSIICGRHHNHNFKTEQSNTDMYTCKRLSASLPQDFIYKNSKGKTILYYHILHVASAFTSLLTFYSLLNCFLFIAWLTLGQNMLQARKCQKCSMFNKYEIQ